MHSKKLSIVTVNLNNSSGLKKTIESVVHQTFKDFEFIVIDGGSTDGGVEVIRQYEDKIDYWVSEPDKGIFNAMNKGTLVARGEFLLFLNSGDYFVNERILQTFIEDIDGYDIIYGDWLQYYADDRIIEGKYPDFLSFYFVAFKSGLPHQATLIRRSVLLANNLYDEDMKIISDWKFFMLAIFKQQCKYLHKPKYIVYYNNEGVSSTEKAYEVQTIERNTFLKSEFPNFMGEKQEGDNLRKIIRYFNNLFIIRVLKKIGLIKKENTTN